MRAVLALFVLLALSVGAFAAEIRKGATMQVKPDSIWFEDTAKLTRWQVLKKSGNAAALATYQDAALSKRDIWQFLSPLTVKILGYRSRDNQVRVEMTTPGRLLGTTWSLDGGALAR
jgi:hypothetical protein